MRIITNKKDTSLDKFLYIFWIMCVIAIVLLSLWETSATTPKEAEEKQREVMTINYKSSIKWGKYNQAVTIYAKQFEEMKARGYSNTRILDLLAIKSMECNKYTSCIGQNWHDIWPFQINRVHKEQYNNSVALHKQQKYATLFLYQLSYANWLIESYEDRFCWKHIFKQIGQTYTNKKRFYCVAVSYNWHPRYKHTYKKIAWLKREMIKKHLIDNNHL